jgi:hypothetical protein
LESVDVVPLSAGDARRNRGGPESPGVEDELLEDELLEDELPEELLGELPGTICAGGEPSELELALRIRGGALSSLLELLLDELLLDELLDELLLRVLSSELEVARRSLGRSGSLSLLDELLFDELLFDELLLVVLSSELDARRSLGRLLSLLLDELFEALLDELPEEELFAMGRDVSSVASDAAECSSGVPALTIVMFTAW